MFTDYIIVYVEIWKNWPKTSGTNKGYSKVARNKNEQMGFDIKNTIPITFSTTQNKICRYILNRKCKRPIGGNLRNFEGQNQITK